jgi:UDP-glucose 4-epimerase
MKILITGAAGFIGSYLCEFMLGKNHIVHGIDNLSNGNLDNLQKSFDFNTFSFTEMDVCETESMSSMLRENSFDEVWHLAANTDIISSHESPIRDFKDCAQATVSVLEAMRVTNTQKIIFASSGSVYGALGTGASVNENVGPLMPLSTYGAGKLASEAFIASYANLYGIKSYIFRFGNVLGDRINHGVIYDFARKLKANPTVLHVLGNGKQEKNYFRVDDCISGMWQISRKEIYGENCIILNLGNSTLTNVLRIAEIVIEESHLSNVELVVEGKDLAWPGDQPIIRLDCTKATGFDWVCKVDSDGAVRQTSRELLSGVGLIK